MSPGLELEDPCRIYSFIHACIRSFIQKNTYEVVCTMLDNLNIMVNMTVFPAFMCSVSYEEESIYIIVGC